MELTSKQSWIIDEVNPRVVSVFKIRHLGRSLLLTRLKRSWTREPVGQVVATYPCIKPKGSKQVVANFPLKLGVQVNRVFSKRRLQLNYMTHGPIQIFEGRLGTRQPFSPWIDLITLHQRLSGNATTNMERLLAYRLPFPRPSNLAGERFFSKRSKRVISSINDLPKRIFFLKLLAN